MGPLWGQIWQGQQRDPLQALVEMTLSGTEKKEMKQYILVDAEESQGRGL